MNCFPYNHIIYTQANFILEQFGLELGTLEFGRPSVRSAAAAAAAFRQRASPKALFLVVHAGLFAPPIFHLDACTYGVQRRNLRL